MTKHEHSAGAVIYHSQGSTTEYLLLHYPPRKKEKAGKKDQKEVKKNNGHWDYVKGHIEEGESEKETLLREAEEETGLTEDQLEFINDFKEKIEYWFRKEGDLIHKTVDFFLLEAKNKKITLSDEHDDYAWLEYERAKERLTFDNAQEVLAAAKAATDFHR